MNSDRELLELAGKAAGLDLLPHPNRSLGGLHFVHRRGGNWNPLADDGDEARLEAALSLCVLWYQRRVSVGADDDSVCTEMFADHGGDKQAARRKAGVRAAAEIGRGMV